MESGFTVGRGNDVYYEGASTRSWMDLMVKAVSRSDSRARNVGDGRVEPSMLKPIDRYKWGFCAFPF